MPKTNKVSKSELISELAETTHLTKTQIKDVFDALEHMIANAMKAGETVTIPNLVKIYVHKKPASKARDGINPFTQEPMKIKAKPARNVIKVKPIKNLKDMI
jgi:DNA-binding protein HU-beta